MKDELEGPLTDDGENTANAIDSLSRQGPIVGPDWEQPVWLPPLELGSKAFRFTEADTGGIRFRERVVVLEPNGRLTVQTQVTSKNAYTHLRNRVAWTGPNHKIRVFDANGLVVLDWDAGQTNVLCRSDYLHAPNKGASDSVFERAARVSWTITAYRYWSC